MKTPLAPPLPHALASFTPWLAWLALLALLGFAGYKLHDLFEPMAFGHPRWSDSYMYWFARAHLDLGLATTAGLNVEGVTSSGQPIFYLSHPPLAGLMQAVMVNWLGGEYWTVRVLPLLFNLVNAGLLALLAWRLVGALAAPLAVLLLVGMPFILEYGSSNESYQVFAMTGGLAGYLIYLHFLANRRWLTLLAALGCFALGMGFTWLSGFMALAMLGHLWLQDRSRRDKLLASLLAGLVLGTAALLLLAQQGLVTGDFLYPFKRAMERSNAPAGLVVTWAELLKVQSARYFGYFGPIVSALTAYWLLRRLAPKPDWRAVDTWALLIWLPGLVYGFLLRDVARQHDFLMLGFAPGAALMATLGLLDLLRDGDRLLSGRRAALALLLATILGLHALGAVRSATNFEAQEALDLAQGAARTAFHLRDLPVTTLLAADPTARMAVRRDALDGADYVSLLPYLDYLVRRPVRAVDDLAALRALACAATNSGRLLVVLQSGAERIHNRLPIPPEWVQITHQFDQVSVVHIKPMPPKQCAGVAGR